MILEGKRILLGICGGIAAYKAADLCSKLVQAGAHVEVIMTEAATHFVAPLTFAALSGHDTRLSLWEGSDIAHIALAREHDLFLIAPATANTLAKLALGLADNLLTATALASRAPLLVAPAMETGMWEHPATQAHVQMLRQRGVTIAGPGMGRLASGGVGAGRMLEPWEIVEWARWRLGREGPLAGVRVLITAGPTREPLDPVRFLSNRSSGKMGMALAQEARDRGAEVLLVHGPIALPTPPGIEAAAVESAEQMRDAVVDRLDETDILIGAAAVADYRPAAVASEKIKKAGELTLTLVRTPDILSRVADHREQHGTPRLLVGFAAETADLLEQAKEKLYAKRLDLIVANDVSAPDAGFAVDTNRVTLLDAVGNVEPLPLLPKVEVAARIMDRVIELWNSLGSGER